MQPFGLDQPSYNQPALGHEHALFGEELVIGHVAVRGEPGVVGIVDADDGHARIVKGAAGISLIAGTNGGTND